MLSHYDAKPFTTYWYYNKGVEECSKCNGNHVHYLLRYRIYLGMRYPIIPTGTYYYSICSNCISHIIYECRTDVTQALASLKNKKPTKYNKYSQLDFDNYIENEPMIFGTAEELNKNIELHINDMKKKLKR